MISVNHLNLKGKKGYTGKILDGNFQITVRDTSSYFRKMENGKIIRNSFKKWWKHCQKISA